ncbi:MAG: glycosyltransferase family 2 protein, partial [Elusimicrobiota bacterium]
RGRFLLMADADGSYDFEECGAYVEKLRAGFDLVVGNRFQGVIAPGAMPFLHRYLGTPVLTAVMNLLFGAGLGDTNCGMRALRRDAFERMGLKADGMEFATEMLVKASLISLKIAEVPCNLYKDLRDRPPHLRTWRDGWRHLRFILLFSPMGTFFFPGVFCSAVGGLLLLGLTARDWAAPNALGWLTSRHMLTALLFWLMGTSILGLGVVAQEADYQERYDARSHLRAFLHRTFSLEKGLILGCALALLGGAVLFYLPISYYGHRLPRGPDTLRLDAAILAIAAVLTGVQCVFVSFALGLFYHRVK